MVEVSRTGVVLDALPFNPAEAAHAVARSLSPPDQAPASPSSGDGRREGPRGTARAAVGSTVAPAPRVRTLIFAEGFVRRMVMRAKDVMESPVLTVEAGTDALTCARTMVERHKGYAIVMRSATVAGIVTEWDFLEKLLAVGADPSRVIIGDIATASVHSCTPETPTDEVVARMAREGIRRMIVRSGDQVLGIITARTVLANFREYVDRLSSEIAGYHSDPTALG